ncbi:allophanate hydrolase-related protein [Methylophilus aquaticus]|uniref:Amidase n=1 Tax=Methylophilus aquaticus TaxID=1971610 RepID=A0ABT9JRW8_9PROT|nr:amidase [Methylophilus aquaticus]MDP8567316.1 amidase [Methylophilus aquaticus]
MTPSIPASSHMIMVAVCGGHMQGLPLNAELVALGAIFVCEAKTAAIYRLFKLPQFEPPRPGLVRVNQPPGQAIAVEIWQLPLEAYGTLVARVPPPLCFGTLTLSNGSQVQGFLCESYAAEHGMDISAFGGWRAYLQSVQSS